MTSRVEKARMMDQVKPLQTSPERKSKKKSKSKKTKAAAARRNGRPKLSGSPEFASPSLSSSSSSSSLFSSGVMISNPVLSPVRVKPKKESQLSKWLKDPVMRIIMDDVAKFAINVIQLCDPYWAEKSNLPHHENEADRVLRNNDPRFSSFQIFNLYKQLFRPQELIAYAKRVQVSEFDLQDVQPEQPDLYEKLVPLIQQATPFYESSQGQQVFRTLYSRLAKDKKYRIDELLLGKTNPFQIQPEDSAYQQLVLCGSRLVSEFLQSKHMVAQRLRDNQPPDQLFPVVALAAVMVAYLNLGYDEECLAFPRKWQTWSQQFHVPQKLLADVFGALLLLKNSNCFSIPKPRYTVVEFDKKHNFYWPFANQSQSQSSQSSSETKTRRRSAWEEASHFPLSQPTAAATATIARSSVLQSPRSKSKPTKPKTKKINHSQPSFQPPTQVSQAAAHVALPITQGSWVSRSPEYPPMSDDESSKSNFTVSPFRSEEMVMHSNRSDRSILF